MKIQPAILALSLAALTATASASHVYRGFAVGNPDLSTWHPQAEPGNRGAPGPAFDFYQGLTSPDLSPPPRRAERTAQKDSGFDFYHGLASPDLSPPPYR